MAELRQAVAGEINSGKEAVLSQVDALKQLQDINTKILAENASLKDQLARVQSLVATPEGSVSPSNSQTVSA